MMFCLASDGVDLNLVGFGDAFSLDFGGLGVVVWSARYFGFG